MSKLTDRELNALYCDMLDETYGDVKIGGYTYCTSDALKSVDPTAFRCGFNDWLDSETGETLWELDGEYYDSDPSDGDV